MVTPTRRPLPRLSLHDLIEIDEFIELNKKAITKAEINRINELIRVYHRERTVENRRRIKIFLIYLRRSILPSPQLPCHRSLTQKIKKIDGELSNSTTSDSSEDDIKVTPIRRHPIKERLYYRKNCETKKRGKSLPRMGVTICRRSPPVFEL